MNGKLRSAVSPCRSLSSTVLLADAAVPAVQWFLSRGGAVPMVWRMSEAIAFDTHRFVKRLTDCGFTEKQAETLADEHVALLNANLATKADIAKVEARIAQVEAGVDALRQETKAAIEASKSDLMKWLIGLLIAQGGLIVALVKLL